MFPDFPGLFFLHDVWKGVNEGYKLSSCPFRWVALRSTQPPFAILNKKSGRIVPFSGTMRPLAGELTYLVLKYGLVALLFPNELLRVFPPLLPLPVPRVLPHVSPRLVPTERLRLSSQFPLALLALLARRGPSLDQVRARLWATLGALLDGPPVPARGLNRGSRPGTSCDAIR